MLALGHLDGRNGFAGRLGPLTVAVGFDHQRPVDHVHATCKSELAAAVGHELDRGSLERRKRVVDLEVGEHDSRGAISCLLAIEDEPQRDALLGTDQAGRVGALDGDLDLLMGSAALCFAELLVAEEKPGQTGDRQSPADSDRNLGSHLYSTPIR